MAKDVGVLVVSYGSREAAIVDQLERSSYKPAIYVADKQKNPFNVGAAERTKGKHIVISDLNDVERISEFAKRYRDRIDFVIPGCEGPIINGLRDRIEGDLDIPVICPTGEYALEASKVEQRELIDECHPEANPEYRVFDPEDYRGNENKLKRDVTEWIHHGLGGVQNSVIKPDKPGYGKGVGVGGEHFSDPESAWEHFLTLYDDEKECVIVEKRIEGEEFSLQSWSDGKHLVHTPAVRDYKRAFGGDLGPNTGGMGSYKDIGNILPFMKQEDLDNAYLISDKIFEKLRGNGENPETRGVMYFAYICTKDGVKVLEINSRPGDPELQNLTPIAKFDMIDMFNDIVNGNLTSLDFENLATVVTYAVPMDYGGYMDKFTGSRQVDLSGAEELKKKYGDNLRIYPGSMEIDIDGTIRALKSRAVCTVGIGDSIQEAREISLKAIRAINGPLWNRMDIASTGHIARSNLNMKVLREDI